MARLQRRPYGNVTNWQRKRARAGLQARHAAKLWRYVSLLLLLPLYVVALYSFALISSKSLLPLYRLALASKSSFRL